MNFYSKVIDISLDEFGCTLTFSEEEHEYENERRPINELMNAIGKYILLQRTFPEDDFEDNCYTFEPADFDKACELKDFIIDLYPTAFELTINGDFYQVQFREDDKKFEQIKSAVELITNGRGILNIHRMSK